MNYTIERRDKIVIFALKHRSLNAEVSPKFKAELLIVCQPNIDALVIDLTTVELIDSSGLGALLLANRQLKDHEIPVYLVGIQPMVQTLLDISQIETLFDYAPTIDEAVDEINEKLLS